MSSPEPLDLDAIEAKVLGGENYDPDTDWEGIAEALITEVKRLRAPVNLDPFPLSGIPDDQVVAHIEALRREVKRLRVIAQEVEEERERQQEIEAASHRLQGH